MFQRLLGIFRPREGLTRDERNLVLLLGAAFMVSNYDMFLLGIALPDIQASFGIAEGEEGRFVAVARLGSILALPIALLADRTGRRRLLLFTIVGFTICTVLTGFAPNAASFQFLQFFAKAFMDADEILSLVVILEEINARRRGYAVGILGLMGALGNGGAALFYPLADHLPGDWRALYVGAGLPLILILYLRRNLKETTKFEALAAADVERATMWSTIGRYPGRLAAVTLLAILSYVPAGAMLTLMSDFLQDTHDYSRGGVSTLMIVAGAVAMIGNLLGGRLTDIIGRPWGYAIFAIITAIGFGWFYTGPTGILPFAWVLALFSFFALATIGLAVAGELFPTEARTTIATFVKMVSSLAFAAGLWAESLLYRLTGNHAEAIVMLLPGLVIAAVVAVIFIPETAGRDLDDVSGSEPVR